MTPLTSEIIKIEHESWEFYLAPAAVSQTGPELAKMIEKREYFEPIDSSINRVHRGGVSRLTAETGKTLILRKYLRGGYLSHIVKSTHIHPIGSPAKTRPLLELEVLLQLKDHDFATLRPAFAAVKRLASGFLYQGYIATEELTNVSNLLGLATSAHSLEQLKLASFQAGEQAAELLNLGIFHRDLHPGNVLLNQANGQTLVIDFDRFLKFVELGQQEPFRRRLIERWSRSINKHGLEEFMTHEFSRGLNRDVTRSVYQ